MDKSLSPVIVVRLHWEQIEQKLLLEMDGRISTTH